MTTIPSAIKKAGRSRLLRGIVVLLAAVSIARAQDPEMMSLHLVAHTGLPEKGNAFTRHSYSVQQVLVDLYDVVCQADLAGVIERFGSESGYPPAFTGSEMSAFSNALLYLLTDFSMNPACFTNPIAVGQKSFVDQTGDYFTTDYPDLFIPRSLDQ
jgi:hypothetical protein